MFVLLVTTCLLNGTDCYPSSVAEDFGQFECQSRSQSIAAQWISERPNRKVARIACVPKQRIGFYLGRGEA